MRISKFFIFFFILFFWGLALSDFFLASRLGHESIGKNAGRNLQYGPRTRLVSGISPHCGCMLCCFANTFNFSWDKPHFFLASSLGHNSMGKNSGRNLQYGPRTRLVRDISPHSDCMLCYFANTFNFCWDNLSSVSYSATTILLTVLQQFQCPVQFCFALFKTTVPRLYCLHLRISSPSERRLCLFNRQK